MVNLQLWHESNVVRKFHAYYVINNKELLQTGSIVFPQSILALSDLHVQRYILSRMTYS
jgi:hypothetical protein